MTDSIALDLDQVVNIKTVNAIKEKLDEALKQEKDVLLLGGSVEQVDTAGLQLLAAFNERLKCTGHHMRWEDPSEEVQQVASLLGLEKAVSLQ